MAEGRETQNQSQRKKNQDKSTRSTASVADCNCFAVFPGNRKGKFNIFLKKCFGSDNRLSKKKL